MSPWRRGGDVAGRGAWASRPRSAILTREAAAGRGEALRGEAGCGGEGVPTGAGRDGATRAPGAAARSRAPCPGPPSMKTPADTGGGGGSTCGGDLLPRETGRKNFGWGLEGLWGARLIPSSRGPPSTRDLLLLAARAGVLPGSPNSVDPFGMVWVLRLLGFPFPDPATWVLPGSLGWQSPLPVVLSRCTPGAGTCAG